VGCDDKVDNTPDSNPNLSIYGHLVFHLSSGGAPTASIMPDMSQDPLVIEGGPGNERVAANGSVWLDVLDAAAIYRKSIVIGQQVLFGEVML
jgi:hypothetical protein